MPQHVIHTKPCSQPSPHSAFLTLASQALLPQVNHPVMACQLKSPHESNAFLTELKKLHDTIKLDRDATGHEIFMFFTNDWHQNLSLKTVTVTAVRPAALCVCTPP